MDGYDFSDVASLVSEPPMSAGGGASPSFNWSGFDTPSVGSVASAATPSGGGGGWADIASGFRSGLQGFGDVARNILPVAQVGAAGLGVAQNIQGAGQLAKQTKLAEGAARRQDQIAGQAQATATPVAEYGADQLRRAGLGEVPPAVRASIDQWKASALQTIRQQAAASGQGNSTQALQWEAWVDQQAKAMEASALNDMAKTGVLASGTAGGILGTGAAAAGGAGAQAAQQQGSLQDLIGQANRALAALAGGAR